MWNFLYKLTLIAVIISCEKEENTFVKNPFSVLSDQETIELNGEIGTNSLDHFNKIIAEYPTIRLISIKQCDGSLDDEVNFLLMERIHGLGINTHLQDQGLIASGGVDVFLSGLIRTMGVNTRIGVHAWSDGNVSATDFPRGHQNHQPYINSYISIGFSPSAAEELYYFIITAAPSDDIHWMTPDEIAYYHILHP